jgi:hypothetical protein
MVIGFADVVTTEMLTQTVLMVAAMPTLHQPVQELALPQGI